MKYPVTMTMGATTDTMHTLPSALYGLIPTLLMPKDRESTIFELPFLIIPLLMKSGQNIVVVALAAIEIRDLILIILPTQSYPCSTL